MKHFIIAVILLFALVVFIAVNGVCVTASVNAVIEEIKKMPDSPENLLATDYKFDAFRDMWYERHAYLSLSIHMCELERCCDAIAKLCSAGENKLYDEYITSKKCLEAILAELADGESLSFFSIF